MQHVLRVVNVQHLMQHALESYVSIQHQMQHTYSESYVSSNLMQHVLRVVRVQHLMQHTH